MKTSIFPHETLGRVILLCVLVMGVFTYDDCAADEVTPNKPANVLKFKEEANKKKEEAKKREEQIRKQQQAAIEAQYKMMGKLLLASELGFIRAVCDVPVEHRARVKEAGEKSLDTSVKMLAEFQSRPNRGVPKDLPEPEKSLRTALHSALKEALPPEEYAKYETELNKRKEATKYATVNLIVNRLDQQLWLSSNQRDAITQQLLTEWQDSNENWLSITNYGNRTLPTIPDKTVVPHLTVRQKSAWNNIQKISTSTIHFLNRNWIGLADDPNDDYWGDKDTSIPAKTKEDKPVSQRRASEERGSA